MGRPDVDIEPPSLVLTPGGARYRLAWGSDPGTGSGWHSATEDGAGEHVTAAAWGTLTAAAQTSATALDAALTGSTAARAWAAAKARAVAAGQTDLIAATTAAYAAWQTGSLNSVWVKR
jgi:hypothetical protein